MAQYVYDAKILANLVAQAQKAYDARQSANQWHNQQVDKERTEVIKPLIDKFGITGISVLQEIKSAALISELQKAELKYHVLDGYLRPTYKHTPAVKRPFFVLKSVEKVILSQEEHDTLNYCLNL